MNEKAESPGLAAKRAFLQLSVEVRGRILAAQAEEAQADYVEFAQEREEWQGSQADEILISAEKRPI